jgi:hypothetical protein
MGEHVEAFTQARESAMELAIKKHEEAKGAAG